MVPRHPCIPIDAGVRVQQWHRFDAALALGWSHRIVFVFKRIRLKAILEPQDFCETGIDSFDFRLRG